MLIAAGKTDVTVDVYFVDDDGGTAPGEPTTGKLFSDIETGGSASYHRQGAARVDFTLVTQTAAGAHTDGGFVLIDDTNMPGLYRLDVPDAAFATGADYVVIQLVMAAANNSIMRPLLISLTETPAGIAALQSDLDNGTDGLGALKTLIDTVNTDLANGTDGLGALKTLLDAIPTTAMRGTDSAALASVCTEVRLATLTDWINGGRLDLLIDAIKAITDQFVFTKANEVDANMQSINDVGLKGAGTSGNPWAPV